MAAAGALSATEPPTDTSSFFIESKKRKNQSGIKKRGKSEENIWPNWNCPDKYRVPLEEKKNVSILLCPQQAAQSLSRSSEGGEADETSKQNETSAESCLAKKAKNIFDAAAEVQHR